MSEDRSDSPRQRSRTAVLGFLFRMGGLPEVREKLVDAVAGASMSFDFAVPAALGGVESEGLLDLTSSPQVRVLIR